MLSADLNRTRRLGVELEFALCQLGGGDQNDVRRMLAEILTSNGVPAIARGYSHAPVPHGVDICVEYDASVRGESRYQNLRWIPVEMKTRVLCGMDDWERVVPRAIAIVHYLGARVNASCGFHCHVELPEAAERPHCIRSLYNVTHRIESLLYGLQPPSRRSGGYSRPMPDVSGRLAHCRSRLGQPPEAVARVTETNLLWLGLIARHERGRALTPKGIEHVRAERRLSRMDAQTEEA